MRALCRRRSALVAKADIVAASRLKVRFKWSLIDSGLSHPYVSVIKKSECYFILQDNTISYLAFWMNFVIFSI